MQPLHVALHVGKDAFSLHQDHQKNDGMATPRSREMLAASCSCEYDLEGAQSA